MNVSSSSTSKTSHIGVQSYELLHQVKQGCFDGVKKLLEAGSPTWMCDPYGNTPLHLAVACKQYKIAKLLVDHKACLTTLNNAQKSPVDLAKEINSKDLIQLFERIQSRPVRGYMDEQGAKIRIENFSALKSWWSDVGELYAHRKQTRPFQIMQKLSKLPQTPDSISGRYACHLLEVIVWEAEQARAWMELCCSIQETLLACASLKKLGVDICHTGTTIQYNGGVDWWKSDSETFALWVALGGSVHSDNELNINDGVHKRLAELYSQGLVNSNLYIQRFIHTITSMSRAQTHYCKMEDQLYALAKLRNGMMAFHKDGLNGKGYNKSQTNIVRIAAPKYIELSRLLRYFLLAWVPERANTGSCDCFDYMMHYCLIATYHIKVPKTYLDEQKALYNAIWRRVSHEDKAKFKPKPPKELNSSHKDILQYSSRHASFTLRLNLDSKEQKKTPSSKQTKKTARPQIPESPFHEGTISIPDDRVSSSSTTYNQPKQTGDSQSRSKYQQTNSCLWAAKQRPPFRYHNRVTRWFIQPSKAEAIRQFLDQGTQQYRNLDKQQLSRQHFYHGFSIMVDRLFCISGFKDQYVICKKSTYSLVARVEFMKDGHVDAVLISYGVDSSDICYHRHCRPLTTGEVQKFGWSDVANKEDLVTQQSRPEKLRADNFELSWEGDLLEYQLDLGYYQITDNTHKVQISIYPLSREKRK